jgi:hypothetical protein
MPVILDDVTVDQLRAKLLTLSENDRRSLFDCLAESLGMERVEETPEEERARWKARIARYDSGTKKGISQTEMDAYLAKYES